MNYSKISLSLKSFKPSEMQIWATAERASNNFMFNFELKNVSPNIVWPVPNDSPKHADGLWTSTCFEAFIGHQSHPKYVEWNFSPSQDWACYAFDHYRDRARQEHRWQPPQIVATMGQESARVQVQVNAAPCLTILGEAGDLLIGLSAVVQHQGKDLEYWAISHNKDTPDFHDRDSFLIWE